MSDCDFISANSAVCTGYSLWFAYKKHVGMLEVFASARIATEKQFALQALYRFHAALK